MPPPNYKLDLHLQSFFQFSYPLQTPLICSSSPHRPTLLSPLLGFKNRLPSSTPPSISLLNALLSTFPSYTSPFSQLTPHSPLFSPLLLRLIILFHRNPPLLYTLSPLNPSFSSSLLLFILLLQPLAFLLIFSHFLNQPSPMINLLLIAQVPLLIPHSILASYIPLLFTFSSIYYLYAHILISPPPSLSLPLILTLILDYEIHLARYVVHFARVQAWRSSEFVSPSQCPVRLHTLARRHFSKVKSVA